MRTQREYMLRPGPPEMSMSATCIKETSGITMCGQMPAHSNIYAFIGINGSGRAVQNLQRRQH